jgi:hypothetical protein
LSEGAVVFHARSLAALESTRGLRDDAFIPKRGHKRVNCLID